MKTNLKNIYNYLFFSDLQFTNRTTKLFFRQISKGFIDLLYMLGYHYTKILL